MEAGPRLTIQSMASLVLFGASIGLPTRSPSSATTSAAVRVAELPASVHAADADATEHQLWKEHEDVTRLPLHLKKSTR